MNTSITFYLNNISVEERLDLIADFYHKIPIRLQATLSTENINKNVTCIRFDLEGKDIDLDLIYTEAAELTKPGCLVTYGRSKC